MVEADRSPPRCCIRGGLGMLDGDYGRSEEKAFTKSRHPARCIPKAPRRRALTSPVVNFIKLSKELTYSSFFDFHLFIAFKACHKKAASWMAIITRIVDKATSRHSPLVKLLLRRNARRALTSTTFGKSEITAFANSIWGDLPTPEQRVRT